MGDKISPQQAELYMYEHAAKLLDVVEMCDNDENKRTYRAAAKIAAANIRKLAEEVKTNEP